MLFHVGVLLLHFLKGGCEGIGAWVFNSVLNAAILFLILNYYVKTHLKKPRRSASDVVKNDSASSLGLDVNGEIEKIQEKNL